MKEVLIVVPSYDESENIAIVLDSLKSLPLAFDVLVIDDGSSDGTANIARSCGAKVVRHPCNLGYGAALQTGYRFAVEEGYRYIIQVDGDGQHDVLDILPVYRALVTQRADLVIGSRFQGDSDFFPGHVKWVAIHMFRWVIRLITRRLISDPTSGLKGLSRHVFMYYAEFNRLPADFPDADFVIDVLLRKWSVVEIPVHNRIRENGQSMHSGIKPVIYMMKVSLSIAVVVLTAFLVTRRQRT